MWVLTAVFFLFSSRKILHSYSWVLLENEMLSNLWTSFSPSVLYQLSWVLWFSIQTWESICPCPQTTYWGISLNPQIKLEDLILLTILSFPIHNHGLYLHWLSSLISFTRDFIHQSSLHIDLIHILLNFYRSI